MINSSSEEMLASQNRVQGLGDHDYFHLWMSKRVRLPSLSKSRFHLGPVTFCKGVRFLFHVGLCNFPVGETIGSLIMWMKS